MQPEKVCPRCGSGDIWELMGECNYSDNVKDPKYEKKAGHTFECQHCGNRWDEP